MMWTFSSRTDHLRGHLVILVILACYTGIAVQQRNPITNFCRRWGHQTAVVDNKLYIDGGLITWNPAPATPENLTNPYFIYHDLSLVSSSGMPPPYANLSKNSSVPNVNGGVLWPDTLNKRIYLFGGEFHKETPWPFALYSYDIINNYWDNYAIPGSPSIDSLSYGAGLSISSRGEGYYYGGWMNNATDASWSGPGIPTSYMLRYDMDSNTWTNSTGPDEVGRAEGVMVYIPAGDGGMIVYFGGIRSTGNGNYAGQPMTEILIYDILSGKSYKQNATGHAPEMRRRFCAGATWVDDQSSYNIYVYGGSGEQLGSRGFDDIYVLTLPSFTWIKLYPADLNTTGDFPHHSLSCNVVNEAQMLIHGGFFPMTNDCDSEDQWGLHNLDMGKQNKDHSPWALFEPNKTHYVVPSEIVSVVGGSANGGATNTVPADGFDHQDLRALMTRKASVASTRTPARSIPGATGKPNSKDLSTGAIAGIAVGGAVVLLAALVGCFCLVRRHRRKHPRRGTNGSQQFMTQSYSYHHPSQPTTLSNQYSQGPWSPQSSHFSTSSPPPFQTRPSTVPPHVGPPVELPTGATNEIPHASPYSETGSSVEPKYDAHGNAWVPQVSMMQVPTQQGYSPSVSPLYDGGVQPDTGTGKYDAAHSRSRTPQELSSDMRESSQSVNSPLHQTYYHP